MNDFLINTDQQALTAHRIDETIDTQPSIRIWLCGPLQVEWVDPDTGRGLPLTQEQLEGKDATQALALLKLLLSQPGRRAHRDWIMEQFWPEQVRSVATHRFHNITSAFRKLFSPPDGRPLLPAIGGKKDSTSLYSLPAYPRLWIDSDAISWQVEQAARMERFGDDALPFWQRAYDLLKRGSFLPDEPYAAWGRRHDASSLLAAIASVYMPSHACIWPITGKLGKLRPSCSYGRTASSIKWMRICYAP